MVTLEAKIEREMFSEYCPHHYTKDYISLFKSKMIVQGNICQCFPYEKTL